MASWVLQSRRRPRRVCGSRSKVRHNTSCFTPPTFIFTRRFKAFDLMIMNGSGGREVMLLECDLCWSCKGKFGGKGGEAIGNLTSRIGFSPWCSSSSHRTPTPSPSLSPTMWSEAGGPKLGPGARGPHGTITRYHDFFSSSVFFSFRLPDHLQKEIKNCPL